MENNYLIFLRCIFLLLISFLISNGINKYLISLQLKKSEGQAISIYLMDSHQVKKKTPTGGGRGIILSILISSLFIIESYLDQVFTCGIIIILFFFFIGLIDDLIKIKHKDYKGLSSLIRFVLEVLVVCLIYYFFDYNNAFDYSLHLNNDIYIYFGSTFIIFVILLIVGSANAVNLTDGLDGLSGGTYLISLLPFSIFLLISNQMNLVYLVLIVYGSTFGFLIHNLHPAKIFMGDSGSLPLGAFLGYLSLVSKKELLLLIIGGIFVLETLSVIIQVLYYKLTRKRIFLMSPFHHHLEKMGKKEYTIVFVFYVLGFTLSLISLIIGLII